MRKRNNCHIIFVLARYRDGVERYKFKISASLSLLRGFDSVTIEFRKQGQLHEGMPVLLGVGIHSDAAAVTLFKEILGYEDDDGHASGRPRVQIITTFVDQYGAEEVLWDSQGLEEKADGGQD